MAYRVATAEPQRFITLTIDTKQWETPRAAYDGTRRQISRLVQEIRRRGRSFEYFRILETTAQGWPHYHLLQKGDFIRQQDLSRAWRKHAKAPVVDIRRVDNPDRAVSYVCKYLFKQETCPFTSRRIAWSRRFFPPPEDNHKEPSNWQLEEYEGSHPLDWIRYHHSHCTFRYERPTWITFASHNHPTIYTNKPIVPPPGAHTSSVE